MKDTKLVAQCQKAIRAFFRVRSIFEEVDLSEIGDSLSQGDGERLAFKGAEGLRYGAGSSGDLKLRYTPERGFFLNRNGMDLEEFLEFQRIVEFEFASVALPFRSMPS